MQGSQILAELSVRIRGLLAPAFEGIGLFGDLGLQSFEVGDLDRVLAGSVDLPDDEAERECDADVSSKRDVSAWSHGGVPVAVVVTEATVVVDGGAAFQSRPVVAYWV